MDFDIKTAKKCTRNFEEFFAHLKNLNFYPKTIFDVGVAKASIYIAYPDAYYYLPEPLWEFEPDLQNILKQYRGEYHICALMSDTGSSTIFKTKNLFGSSMIHKIKKTITWKPSK